MNNAVTLLQKLMLPKQFNRIVDWNKSRNSLELNSDLEIQMLQEEAKEYFDAETFVDRVDAVCDLLFVAVGTVAKTAYNYHIMKPEMFSPIDFVLTDFTGRVIEEGLSADDIIPLISKSLDIVITANEKKGTEKDESGKVKKPDDFVPPEDEIASVIESLMQGVDASEAVDSIFSDRVEC